MAVEVKERDYWTPEMLDYLERSKKVLEENFQPYRVLFNHTPWLQLRETMPDVVNRMHNAEMENRLYGRAVPKEYGGGGYNCLQDSLMMSEEIKIAKSTFPTHWGCHAFNVMSLNWSRYPEVKEKYLRRMVAGGPGQYYITDPESGVDAGSMRTRADRDGDDYVINGPKWWVGSTEGYHGLKWHIVLAKTDTTKRTSGISAFLIDWDTPGQIYGREGDLVCDRYAPRHEVTLKDVRVHYTHILGQEGEGLRCLQDGINYNTVFHSYVGVGIIESALNQLMDYTKKTQRFGSYLYEFQGVHYPIAEMAINAEVLRSIAHRAADMRDEGHPDATTIGSASIRFAGPTAQQVCLKAMELLAGRGVERGEDLSIEQLLRESFVISLFRTPNLDKRFIAAHYLGKKLKAGIVM